MTKKLHGKFVHIVSLGCPKNLVDTEVVTASLLKSGMGLTPDSADADVFLINTCAFLRSARDEAESFIKEAVKWKKRRPDGKIVVSGCLVQWDDKSECAEKFPSVDLWIGIDQIPSAAKLISELFRDDARPGAVRRSPSPTFMADASSNPRFQLTPGHYAYLKISDGCDNRCSYCAIPSIRGALRSRTPESVAREAASLVENGVRELILIAQDSTAYGFDSGDKSGGIVRLLKSVEDAVPAPVWIRLMYSHPAHFSDELINHFARSSRLLPYVEMPLQHISDKILASMNRRTTKKDVETLVSKIRSRIPNVVLRTTFITGFPGETDADFETLREFILEQKFERVGVFAYSPEQGTPAASFKGRVPPRVAEARRDTLLKIQAKISLNFNKLLVGRKFDVIIDSVVKNRGFGRTYMDAPEIDNCVVVEKPPKNLAPGRLVEIEVTKADAYDLKGDFVRCL